MAFSETNLNTADTDVLKMVPRRNIAQLLKLFSYITIGSLKISFRNCVSTLLSTHCKTFVFTGPFDLTRAFNSAQKTIGTTKFYRVLVLSQSNFFSLKLGENKYIFVTIKVHQN